MTELSHVIFSSGLQGENGPVEKPRTNEPCPRTLIGLSCVTKEYDCLCAHVESSTFEIIKNEDGLPLVINLTMQTHGDKHKHAARDGLDLTGLHADYQYSQNAIIATFTLHRRENAGLRLWASERAT